MVNNLKYTIKKDVEKGIYLLNEQGEEVAATDILEKCGDRRVFAFDGKMGAGKTTFIKCLCEAMGTEDVVNSPTFAIVNVYEVEAKGKRCITLIVTELRIFVRRWILEQKSICTRGITALLSGQR